MRLIIMVLFGTALAACERYTDATSPCIGDDGAPVVSRGAVNPLPSSDLPKSQKDCHFEEIT